MTGGIGSGKSTVAGMLLERGAVVVDADRTAREIVEPGTPGLAEIRELFGDAMVRPDGTLDRAALGARVFADPQSRRALERITHPRIRARTRELIEAAPPEAVVVHDIPLLVETAAAPTYHLVVVVDVDDEERVRRLVASRGMLEADARARIANQASRAERIAVADVVVDNNGPTGDLTSQVDRLWARLVEFDRRLRAGRPVESPTMVIAADPAWSGQAGRALARIRARLTSLVGDGYAAAHVGPTAVPGLAAPDLLHLQIGLPGDRAVDEGRVEAVLAGLGLPRIAAADATAGEWRHLSCDPGRPVSLVLRPETSPAHRAALLARDWLTADAGSRTATAALLVTSAPGPDGYPEDWWRSSVDRAEEWAATTGWSMPH